MNKFRNVRTNVRWLLSEVKCSILALNIEKSAFRCLGFKPIFDSKELRLIFRLRLLDQTVNKGLNLNLKEHLCHTLSQRISFISTLQLKTTSDWMLNHPIRITYLTVSDFSEEFENPFSFWWFCKKRYFSVITFQWTSGKSHRHQIPYVDINLSIIRISHLSRQVKRPMTMPHCFFKHTTKSLPILCKFEWNITYII